MINISISNALGWVIDMARKTIKIRKATRTPEQRARDMLEAARARVADKARAIGLPDAQLDRGIIEEVNVPLRDKGRVTTNTTLVNRGGTPVARWKAAKLLSDSQVAAIDYCEALWSRLGGKALVMDMSRIPGAGQGDGWSEQEALDDLKRIKGYVPAKWWGVFENVVRFDEAAGFAGSALTDCRNDQVTAARTTVQFVADIIAMKERLTA